LGTSLRNSGYRQCQQRNAGFSSEHQIHRALGTALIGSFGGVTRRPEIPTQAFEITLGSGARGPSLWNEL
jgi:hypothetical protein